MNNKVRKRLIIVFMGIISFIYFIHFQNNAIVTTEYEISSANLPTSFDGYKIVQLSDLHSKSFGKNQRKLVAKVKKTKPDTIVFTGDLVDSKNYDEKTSLMLIEKLVEIAPVYFVTGNHESWSGKFDSLAENLIDLGVHMMRNEVTELSNGEDRLQIIGIDDPAFVSIDSYSSDLITAEEAITNTTKEAEGNADFNILLSHRPELFSLYSQYDFDLVFSGHAHGGQFRLPFIGGFVAPDQGFFPDYTSGKHMADNTTMIVNRGLGNSIIPIRIFNRPEIVVVTLESQ